MCLTFRLKGFEDTQSPIFKRDLYQAALRIVGWLEIERERWVHIYLLKQPMRYGLLVKDLDI